MAGATNKYVTVTGNGCEDYEYGDRTQELQVLLDKFMRRPEVGAENAINAKNSDLSMEQLLQLAKSSKNGAAFTALWNGSLEGYSSPSEADLALCSHLAFWTGRDAAKMDTMFRKSGSVSYTHLDVYKRQDYVTLRRYLIEYGYLERTRDGSAYWKK